MTADQSSTSNAQRPLEPIQADTGMPQWLTANLKTIIAGIVGAVLVAVLIAGYRWYDERSTRAAIDRLGEIMAMDSGASQVKELTAFAASAPKGLRLNAQFLLADAAMESGDYATAATAYAAIESSAEKALALTAGLGRAAALLKDGKADEALRVLNGMRTKAPQTFMNIILVQTTVAAEAAGNKAEALAAFQALADLPGGAENPYYAYKIAALRASLAGS